MTQLAINQAAFDYITSHDRHFAHSSKSDLWGYLQQAFHVISGHPKMTGYRSATKASIIRALTNLKEKFHGNTRMRTELTAPRHHAWFLVMATYRSTRDGRIFHQRFNTASRMTDAEIQYFTEHTGQPVTGNPLTRQSHKTAMMIDNAIFIAREVTSLIDGSYIRANRENDLSLRKTIMDNLDFEGTIRRLIRFNKEKSVSSIMKVDSAKCIGLEILGVGEIGQVAGTVRPAIAQGDCQINHVDPFPVDLVVNGTNIIDNRTYDPASGSLVDDSARSDHTDSSWKVPGRCLYTTILEYCCFPDPQRIAEKKQHLKRSMMRKTHCDEIEPYQMDQIEKDLSLYAKTRTKTYEQLRNEIHELDNTVALGDDWGLSMSQAEPWLRKMKWGIRLIPHNHNLENTITAANGKCMYGKSKPRHIIYGILRENHFYTVRNDVIPMISKIYTVTLVTEGTEEAAPDKLFAMLSGMNKTVTVPSICKIDEDEDQPTQIRNITVTLSRSGQIMVRLDKNGSMELLAFIHAEEFDIEKYRFVTARGSIDDLAMALIETYKLPVSISANDGSIQRIFVTYRAQLLSDEEDLDEYGHDYKTMKITIYSDYIHGLYNHVQEAVDNDIDHFRKSLSILKNVLHPRYMSEFSSDVRDALDTYKRSGDSIIFPTPQLMDLSGYRFFFIDKRKAYASGLYSLDRIPIVFSFDHFETIDDQRINQNSIGADEKDMFFTVERTDTFNDPCENDAQRNMWINASIIIEKEGVIMTGENLSILLEILGAEFRSAIRVTSCLAPSKYVPNDILDDHSFKQVLMKIATNVMCEKDPKMDGDMKKAGFCYLVGQLQRNRVSRSEGNIYSSSKEAIAYHSLARPIFKDASSSPQLHTPHMWIGYTQGSAALNRSWELVGLSMLCRMRSLYVRKMQECIALGMIPYSIHTDEICCFIKKEMVPTLTNVIDIDSIVLVEHSDLMPVKSVFKQFTLWEHRTEKYKPSPIHEAFDDVAEGFHHEGSVHGKDVINYRLEDEYDVTQLEPLMAKAKTNRLLIEGNCPGSGKTYASLMWKTGSSKDQFLVLCFSNPRAQDYMKKGYVAGTSHFMLGGTSIPGRKTTTAAINRDFNSNRATAGKNIPESVRYVVFDEIYSYALDQLDRLSKFMAAHPEYMYFASGDTKQLEHPEGYCIACKILGMDPDERMQHIVRGILGHVLTLTINKRITDPVKREKLMKMLSIIRDCPAEKFDAEVVLKAIEASDGLVRLLSWKDVKDHLDDGTRFITALRSHRERICAMKYPQSKGAANIDTWDPSLSLQCIKGAYYDSVGEDGVRLTRPDKNGVRHQKKTCVLQSTTWDMNFYDKCYAEDDTEWIRMTLVGYDPKLSINKRTKFEAFFRMEDICDTSCFLPSIAFTGHSVQGASLDEHLMITPHWHRDRADPSIIHTGLCFSQKWFVSVLGRSSTMDVDFVL